METMNLVPACPLKIDFYHNSVLVRPYCADADQERRCRRILLSAQMFAAYLVVIIAHGSRLSDASCLDWFSGTYAVWLSNVKMPVGILADCSSGSVGKFTHIMIW